MPAKRVHDGAEPEMTGDAASARALWSRCEAALDGSRISVASVDLDGRYTWMFNPPAELAADVIGKSDEEVLPADSAQTLIAARNSVLASGEPSEIELELKSE